jgi:predicted acylesterase/phospholipase RssA
MKSKLLPIILIFLFGGLATWAFNRGINPLGLVFLYLSGTSFGAVIAGRSKS